MEAALPDRLTGVFRDVFGDDDLTITDETTSADVPEWDSLANINLLFALEEAFDVHFPDEVFSDFENVGDLRRYLEARSHVSPDRMTAGVPAGRSQQRDERRPPGPGRPVGRGRGSVRPDARRHRHPRREVELHRYPGEPGRPPRDRVRPRPDPRPQRLRRGRAGVRVHRPGERARQPGVQRRGRPAGEAVASRAGHRHRAQRDRRRGADARDHRRRPAGRRLLPRAAAGPGAARPLVGHGVRWARGASPSDSSPAHSGSPTSRRSSSPPRSSPASFRSRRPSPAPGCGRSSSRDCSRPASCSSGVCCTPDRS